MRRCLARSPATPADLGPFAGLGEPWEGGAPNSAVISRVPRGAGDGHPTSRCAPVLGDGPRAPGYSVDEFVPLRVGGSGRLVSSAFVVCLSRSLSLVTRPSVPLPDPHPLHDPSLSPHLGARVSLRPPLQEPTALAAGLGWQPIKPAGQLSRGAPAAARGPSLAGRRKQMVWSVPPSRLRDICFLLPEKFGESEFGVHWGLLQLPKPSFPFRSLTLHSLIHSSLPDTSP